MLIFVQDLVLGFPIFLQSENIEIKKFHSPMVKYYDLIPKEKVKYIINY